MNVLRVIFLFSLGLITFSCTSEFLYEGESENNLKASLRSSLTDDLETEISDLIDYVDSMNTVHQGTVFSDIENGSTLDDLVAEGLLSSTIVTASMDSIESLNSQIVAQESESYLTDWYEDNWEDFPTEERFCFICKETVMTPPTVLPNGDCFQTEVVRWKFLGMIVWEGTGDTVPCP